MIHKTPLVSISVVTYNHHGYIKECLDGILMQKTNFPFEIILGEDESTDGTREICIDYANKYPDKINLFLRCRKDVIYINGNPTGRYNFIENLKASKGKYIALCEGDDYWTDPLKLQKQVDFLEENPDYNICFHNVQIFNQEENKFNVDTITREVPETTNIKDLAKGNFMHTPSVLLRNNLEIPNWFNKAVTGDWALYMLAIKDKKIYKLHDSMAVYREQSNGVWSSKNQFKKLIMMEKTFSLGLKNMELDIESKSNLRELIRSLQDKIKKSKKEIAYDRFKKIKYVLLKPYIQLKNKGKIYLKKNIIRIYEDRLGSFYLKQKGYCPCCEQEVNFVAHNSWLRDHFKCANCSSIPRERALMITIAKEYPSWKSLAIHESSPGNRGHSVNLRKQAKNYTTSQFFVNNTLGTLVNGVRNEDLENLTFENESFDLVITSDVMEHIYEPEKAFKEIHRTLKPGGAHIFSVPLINKHYKTKRWATKGANGEPIFLYEPEWHGNPIDKKGSPVTMHWGFDIVDFIKKCTNDDCTIVYIDDLNYGIRAEYIEIVIAKKKNEK